MLQPAWTRSAVSAVELLPAIVLAFTAVYLLLPDSPAAARRRLRATAGGAGGLALCTGIWQLWQPAEWWAASAVFAMPRVVLLVASGLLAVLAAATVLLARQVLTAQRAVVAVLFAVSVLLLLTGAPIPALVLVAGGGGWWVFGMKPPAADERKPVGFRISHEPLLACLTGGLLTLLLLSVVDRALVVEGNAAARGTQTGRLPQPSQIRAASRVADEAEAAESSRPEPQPQSQFEAFCQAALHGQPLVWGLLIAGGTVLLLGGGGAPDGEDG